VPEITPQNEVPSDHTTPPEAGSNVAPPADGQRIPPDSPEATRELTQAINAREEAAEEVVDEKHENQAEGHARGMAEKAARESGVDKVQAQEDREDDKPRRRK
jgi:hypothetical protein